MVIVDFDLLFEKRIKKIKNSSLKDKVKKHIKRIINNPNIGKPMRNVRKGTRELYIKPFRISYTYIIKDNKIIFLDFYHKDQQ
jgi:mRNA-degrading endonuclease RelE of RelBE toxin-antitoxin system